MVLHHSWHLPKYPIEPERYERLYAFNHKTDEQLSSNARWKVLRIRPGRSEEVIYRLLPSARDREYSGYLTQTMIRYQLGEASSAGMLMAKTCTFHSHPTRNPHLADIPSLKDIHSFLLYRHLRTITVGARKIWIWDKTRATLGTVRKLAVWMEGNHFRVVTRLMKQDFATWPSKYIQTVMRELGWRWPDDLDELNAQWPTMLREIFKIKVRIIPRDPNLE